MKKWLSFGIIGAIICEAALFILTYIFGRNPPAGTISLFPFPPGLFNILAAFFIGFCIGALIGLFRTK